MFCTVGGCSGISKTKVRFDQIRNIAFYASFKHIFLTIPSHARQPFIHLICLVFSAHILILPPSSAERGYLTTEQPKRRQK